MTEYRITYLDKWKNQTSLIYNAETLFSVVKFARKLGQIVSIKFVNSSPYGNPDWEGVNELLEANGE